jgi:hypothetical protein
MLTVSGIADTFYTLPDSLEDDVLYTWEVEAVNQYGTSEPAEEFEFLTDADAASVPAAGREPHNDVMLVRTAPNPFRERTVVEFTVEGAHSAELAVYDVTGKLVKTLLSGRVAAGVQSAHWDGTDSRGRRVSPGVYLFRLEAGGHQAIQKATLLK